MYKLIITLGYIEFSNIVMFMYINLAKRIE